MPSHLSRFEEKIHCVDLTDSAMIKRRVVVERDEGFGVLVADCHEWGEFSFESGFIVDGKRDLKVSRSGVLKCDKIHFTAIDCPYMDIAVSPFEFEKHDVFEDVSNVAASISVHDGAESLVGDVVFAERLEVAAPLDVVPCGVMNEKRFAKCIDVGVDRPAGDSRSVSLECSCDAVHGKRAAYVVEDETHDAFQKRPVAQTEPSKHVLVDDRVEYRGKVVHARRFVSSERCHKRKSAKAHVVGERLGLWHFRERGTVFGEGKRLHCDFHVSPSEERGKFAGKELRVGASHIYVRIALDEKSVNKSFELRHLLNFVKEDVHPVKRVVHFGADERPGIGKSAKYANIWIFKVYGDDLAGIHPFGKQFVAKEPQESCLAATAYSSDDFDDILVSPIGEPIGEIRSIYCTCHSRSPVASRFFARMIPKLQCTVKGVGRLRAGKERT